MTYGSERHKYNGRAGCRRRIVIWDGRNSCAGRVGVVNATEWQLIRKSKASTKCEWGGISRLQIVISSAKSQTGRL